MNSLSVVIPTKNRPADLAETVDGLLAQTTLPRQIVIVDQSEDTASEMRVKARFAEPTSDAASRIELCYVRDSTISGASAARNLAMSMVKSEIVLFLDDDIVIDRNFVSQIIATYVRFPDVTGVSGVVTNYSRPPLAYRVWTRTFAVGVCHDDRQPVYWKAVNVIDGDPVRVSRFGAGLMSFRMSKILGVRFDDNLSGACDGEDVDFCMHLAHDAVLLITPTARLIHKKTPTSRQSRDWLYLQARTMWYLFCRNWSRSAVNCASFLWLNLGFAIASAVVCVRRGSFTPFGTLIQAIVDSRGLLRSGSAATTMARNETAGNVNALR